MMTMLKRIVSVMVSCVFISMVCVPSAHADDATGSITLDVQSAPDNSVQALNDDAPVNGNGLKKQSSMNDVKCHRNATYHVKYETWKGLKRGTLTYGVYVLNAITCGPIKNAKVQLLFSTEGRTNANGYAEITGYAGVYVSDSDNTWTQVYEPISISPLRHYYTPESSDTDVNCMVSERNEVKDCKVNKQSDFYYIDGNGLIGAVLLYPDPSDPPEPVLTSFPMTGKYALTIVISLVLIAGISMVFIHRYGRKYNG